MSTLRLLTIVSAVAERTASSDTLLKALLGLSALLLALAPPMARAGGADGGHNFRFCSGYYALCAASTCKPTVPATNIKVNVAGGGTASFPQVDCTCPILHGKALADVTGGNMQGSCAPPAAPLSTELPIWSLFSHEQQIPQEIYGWVSGDAPVQFCPAALGYGAQSVNCFSFACDQATYITNADGAIVPVATCHCAAGESFAAHRFRRRQGFSYRPVTMIDITVPNFLYPYPLRYSNRSSKIQHICAVRYWSAPRDPSSRRSGPLPDSGRSR